MSWWLTNWRKKSAEIAEALESQPPRSTLLPPPPPGIEHETPRTLRVPLAPVPRDLALDFIDAALAQDLPVELDLDAEYDDFFEEDEYPTRRRSALIAHASPTLPSRIA